MFGSIIGNGNEDDDGDDEDTDGDGDTDDGGDVRFVSWVGDAGVGDFSNTTYQPISRSIKRETCM